eukprot:TRINITY_DN23490_c0_g1_i1.p1 TRINITY_DN23490_c0_g1~~TRINITY_DN23490_c0_g1_i1.p1  ORF type:complete len:231 (+),score=32.32 TRINITY_DN23490_c0_g1_i1:124-816(+)
MLHHKVPEVTKVNEWLANYSDHKRFIAYTIGNDSRFKPPRNAAIPGPGAYKVDRDLPEHEEHDMGTHFRTGTRVQPKYSFPTDSRVAPDGTMKGLSLNPNKEIIDQLGPGQYPLTRLGVTTQQKEFVAYTIDKAKETAEALRDRKKRSDVPGPGVYSIKRYGDDLGQEKAKQMERAVKKGMRCWAAPQYSHIYQCMKPRNNSMPILPSAASQSSSRAASGSEQPAQAAAP